MARAVLFDFNGVLVDDEPLHLELFQRVLADEGIDLTGEDYWAELVGMDDRGVFASVLGGAGRPPDETHLVRLIARKSSYYQERIRRQGYPFYPGARELIDGLARAGLDLVVVSGALREEVEGALRQAGFRDRFKALVTAEDVAASKPDPAGYRLGMEALNTLPPLPARLHHPHETVAVEDTPAGIAAAQGAGLATIGVAHTYPAPELGNADRVVAKIADLTADDLLAW